MLHGTNDSTKLMNVTRSDHAPQYKNSSLTMSQTGKNWQMILDAGENPPLATPPMEGQL